MIKRIEVSNYKSLGIKTVLELGSKNVLVGRNGSGKSNVIDIIRFVADIMKLGLEGAITKRHGIKSIRRWSSGRPLVVSISLEIVEKDFDAKYSFEITGHKKYEYDVKKEYAWIKERDSGVVHSYQVESGTWIVPIPNLKPTLTPLNLCLPLIAGDSRFKPLVDSLRNMAVYNIYPDALRIPQTYDPQKPMEEHGNNWVSILKDQDPETWKSDLIESLYKLTNEIDDISIKQVTGYLITAFKHGESGESNKGKWFDATQESDGTLRIAGIITALIQVPRLTVIGIEEPELTIHPGAIPILYDFISEASAKSQVIITTHSPELLDYWQGATEFIRVVEKIDGLTTIRRVDEEQIHLVKEGLMTIGELHREGELQSSQTSLNFEL
ncbi:MAG: AAA family ATPase [Bacteroidia bacterium]|nr:AAA family ATPase [Bacteroidia bacterium]